MHLLIYQKKYFILQITSQSNLIYRLTKLLVEGENNIKLRKADSCGFVFMRGRILSKALLTLKKKKKILE